MSLLAHWWRRLNESTIGSEAYWYIAVQNSSIYSDTKSLVEKYIRGKTLDVGAGNLAWRRLLSSHAGFYVSSDLSIVNKELDVVFDATKNFPVKTGCLDSLFCHSVLEHTAHPWSTFNEFYRVLRPGGVLLLSVPFI